MKRKEKPDPSPGSHSKLADALERVRFARACIAENRGPDKELARESYEASIADELVPALMDAIDTAVGDMQGRNVERLAELVYKFITKKGL